MVRCLLKPSPNALIGRSNWHFGIKSGHDQGGAELENSSDSDQEPDHALVTTPNGTSMNRLYLSSQDRGEQALATAKPNKFEFNHIKSGLNALS